MIDETTIQGLKEKHGSALSTVEGPKGTLVFRKPTRAEYDRWFDKNHASKNDASKNARELVKACIVYPSTGPSGEEAVDSALEAKPALLMAEFLSAVTGLCGLDEDFEVKKL
jgi:hypothetical protein